MEEKNVTKISLSTFFLILAIIAIVIMGLFIYKLNNDKTAEIQKSTELQAQVNSLNETVSDLQGKLGNIANTISSSKITDETDNLQNVNVANNTSNNKNNSLPFTEKEALTIGKEKYKEIINLIPKSDTTNTFFATQNSSGYWKVNNIPEIKSKFTDSAFKYYCEKFSITEIDGVYYESVGDRGEDEQYISSDIQKVTNITENQIEYIVVAKFYEWDNKNSTYTKEYKFILTKENEDWKVSQYTALG